MSLNISALQDLRAFTRFSDYAMSPSENKPNRVAKFVPKSEVMAVANESDKPGFFGSLFRSAANKRLNNQTRELFKNAVAKLFNGEENIPQEVKDAMHFSKFDGKGRPLTARRINETKSAILGYIREHNDTEFSTLKLGLVLDGAASVEEVEAEGNEIPNGPINATDDDDNIINTSTNTNTIKNAPKPQGNTQTQQTVKKGGIYDNPAFKAMNGKIMFSVGVGKTVQDVQNALNPNSGTKIVTERKSEDEMLNMKPIQHDKKPKSKKPMMFTED